ncbi:MAG TPA: hypothetical protein V6D07_03465 [Trichocoleus sp.]
MSLSVLLAVAIALGLVFWWRQKKGKGLRGASPLSVNLGKSVYGPTRRQLLRMVGGNRATAERLLSRVRQRYPGRPEQWYWEKAIYDIQRDRRA